MQTVDVNIKFWEKYIWNFRDLSNFNSNIKKGKLFRANELISLEKKFDLNLFFRENKIDAIIDLRSVEEVRERKYNSETLNGIKYKNIYFNSFSQPERFKKLYNHISDLEIAYHYFIKNTKYQIKKVFDYFAENCNSIFLFHCVAGKDRTGIISTLLHLLSNQTKENILMDYMATYFFVEEKFIEIVFDEVESYQGIENYLKSCKISEKNISIIKEKFFNIGECEVV